MEKTKSSSEKVSNHLPDDLAFSFLSKLPLKSLLRFTCVRKSWSFLLQDSHFMNMYRINFASNHNYTYADHSCISHELIEPYYELHNALFLYHGNRFENKVRLDWPPPIQHHDLGFQFMGSVLDGTLCFYQNWIIPNIVFWNINTNKFKILPPSPLECPPPFYQRVVCTIHGFGYDHVADDPKLIRHVARCRHVIGDEDFILPHDSFWEVYSLRSNSWKKVEIAMSNGFINAELRVHTNGVCHWWDEPEDWLVSFDLTNDRFFGTPLPSCMDENFGLLVDKRFVALNGSIAFISSWETSCANKLTTFHISVLAELGRIESWTKLFVVGPLPGINHPIGAGNKGDIFFLSKDGKLVQFDLVTQRIEKFDSINYGLGKNTLLYKEVFLPVGELRNVWP